MTHLIWILVLLVQAPGAPTRLILTDAYDSEADCQQSAAWAQQHVKDGDTKVQGICVKRPVIGIST